MSKKQREMRLHIELRKNSGEVLKPERMRVDAYALVESRTGMVLRWSLERHVMEKEKERIESGH
jgi:hypothetical protein